MLKYEIGQSVWFIKNNIIRKSEIRSKKFYIFGDKSPEISYELLLDNEWNSFPEKRLFSSKQALLDHLSETAEEDGK